jgi:hypothetical protein
MELWQALAACAGLLLVVLPLVLWACRHAIGDVIEKNVTPQLRDIHQRIDDHMENEEKSLDKVEKALIFIAAKQGLDLSESVWDK